jgi:hypothetical protein
MLIAIVAGCVLVAVAAVVFWRTRPSVVDRAHYDLLAAGMSQADVERILGPPRNECHTDADVWVPRNGKVVSAEVTLGGPPVRVFADGADGGDGEHELVWIGPEALIAVRLAADGRVLNTHFSTVQLVERPTILDWLTRWLK